MPRARHALAATALLGLLACSRDEAAAPAALSPDAAPSSAPATTAPSGLIRTGLANMREAADPKSAWRATLMRGERVAVLERAAGALRVRLSDGSEGFLDENAVLVGEVEEVLVTADRPLFQRPDPAALREGTVKLGTLLFVLRDKDGWLEVQLPRGRTGWMQAGDVSRDATELTVARNLFRYELLRDAKQKARQEQAAQILAETIASYPQSIVLQASGLAPQAASAPGADAPSGPADTATPPATGAEAPGSSSRPAAPGAP